MYPSSPKTLALFAILVLVSIAVRPVSAQQSLPVPPAPAPTVISNPPMAPAPPADRWSSKAELSYVATSGNADTTTAKVGAETQYKWDGWTLYMRGAFLASNSAEEKRRRIDGLVRGSRSVSPRLELFGQVLYLRNTFAGINHSIYPLAGLAYSVVDSTPQSLKTRVGLGYGQENRLRQASSGFATADAETNYRWTFSKTAELREDTTFTTNLQRGADWRMANVASVAASLNAALSLKVSHTFNYLNQPVPGYERVDTVTAAAIVATF